jgi:hypothetical protein
MIARNEQKMKDKLKDINTETMYIVADFSKMTSIDDYE